MSIEDVTAYEKNTRKGTLCKYSVKNTKKELAQGVISVLDKALEGYSKLDKHQLGLITAQQAMDELGLKIQHSKTLGRGRA